MVRLAVSLDEIELGDTVLPPSWQVEVAGIPISDGEGSAILWGFARRVDAELAREFLSGLAVDWSAPSAEMWRQLKTAGYPTREALMEAACQRLQW